MLETALPSLDSNLMHPWRRVLKSACASRLQAEYGSGSEANVPDVSRTADRCCHFQLEVLGSSWVALL